MFELFGTDRRAPRRGKMPLLISTIMHLLVVAVVFIGGLTAPALVERVEPEYPELAVRAKVQGVVILEAVVDRDGRVEDVRVLRSIRLLDAAAMDAVRKWRYSPLLLNGKPERFVLTVTVSFNIGA
jgi:protein TonB